MNGRTVSDRSRQCASYFVDRDHRIAASLRFTAMAQKKSSTDKTVREAVRKQNESERELAFMLANGQLPDSMLPLQQQQACKIASRATLFEIVRENIEDFEMEAHAAVDDAVKTLSLQSLVASDDDISAAIKMALVFSKVHKTEDTMECNEPEDSAEMEQDKSNKQCSE